jgi:hypothetical protein
MVLNVMWATIGAVIRFVLTYSIPKTIDKKNIGIGSVTVFGSRDDRTLFAIVRIGIAIIDVIAPSIASAGICFMFIPKSFSRICFTVAKYSITASVAHVIPAVANMIFRRSVSYGNASGLLT